LFDHDRVCLKAGTTLPIMSWIMKRADTGSGIDRGQDEQCFEQDREVVPDPHHGSPAEHA